MLGTAGNPKSSAGKTAAAAKGGKNSAKVTHLLQTPHMCPPPPCTPTPSLYVYLVSVSWLALCRQPPFAASLPPDLLNCSVSITVLHQRPSTACFWPPPPYDAVQTNFCMLLHFLWQRCRIHLMVLNGFILEGLQALLACTGSQENHRHKEEVTSSGEGCTVCRRQEGRQEKGS